MISIDEALRLVLMHAQRMTPTRMPATETLGLILAEDVVSDVDSPPHDKSMVDGYAVVESDLEVGTELTVIEEVAAGAVPERPISAGTATRIMTGAPIPEGASAVVMVEHTVPVGDSEQTDRIRITRQPDPGTRNIMRQGTSLHCGQRVLSQGSRIRAIEIGLASEVGRAELSVIPRPAVAVLATGNELVPVDSTPQPGQIRNSNGPMLGALVRQAGFQATLLGVGRDERRHLCDLVQRGLSQDVLVLSGGVSAGKFDLVPSVMAEMGIEQVFHKVRLKPGKPLWFGVRPANGAVKLVFGLPGNPVSSLVCFELFVRPALLQMAGGRDVRRVSRPATLAVPFAHRGDRPAYYPSRLEEDGERLRVRPLAWVGSADLRALAEANCLAHFPAGEREHQPGETVAVYDL